MKKICYVLFKEKELMFFFIYFIQLFFMLF